MNRSRSVIAAFHFGRQGFTDILTVPFLTGAAGDSPGTAFPSSHVAGALTVAWFGCLWLGRAGAALLCVLATLVTVGTVYTGNHFAIDSLAGLLWGAGAQALIVPALARSGQD